MGAAGNAASRYIALSKAATYLKHSPQSSETTHKLQSLLDGHLGQKLIVETLEFNDEYINSLHQAYTESVSGWKLFSLMEALFWVFSCLLFLVTLGINEQSRKQSTTDKQPPSPG